MTGTYVYCVVRSTRKPGRARVPPGLPGADRPVPQRLAGNLWVVTASVPLDVYGPGALEASLGDLEWISTMALAHEAVVEHFVTSRGTTVIPMKLFTMFSTPARAADVMGRRRRELERVFQHIEGCEEWGVRVTRSESRTAAPRPAGTRSGTAFLAARKQARDASRAAVVAAAEAADTAFSSLSEIARDRRRRSADAPGAAAPLLDAAFLVPARRRARFHAVAESLAKDVARTGGQMTLTGPWPPYNFVAAEEAS
jgi:hypothetical protein